ncbi:hypothetical protein N4G70_35980 [Streptomyces sp. ASQP_92]|uniref:hypothetical protein n=1 Tax=Streptomyces sp. ASQP_92 TaxID=2979116 RepID=UPI0021BF1C5E|nr:hypothetical protein [Streptomyces sp. ASQP_92]MCT9094201.1 hypothetical protein [Streptomyces sp. ASQP_92]
MQSDDKLINGQPNPNSPSFLDLLNQTPPPPDTDLNKDPGTTRFTQLRAAWNASWEHGGFLHGRWEELRQAPQAGWHGMAHWIKALLALIGVCAVIILLDTAGDIFDATVSRMVDAAPATRTGTSAANGLWGVVETPLRSYIAHHTAGLAVSASAVFAFWQLVGWFGLIGGFIGSTGARITWTCWGAGSVLAVWSAAPADGRTVATGIAVLAWTIASTVALRGLSLRPVVSNFIHIPAPAPAPDNVHPFQR